MTRISRPGAVLVAVCVAHAAFNFYLNQAGEGVAHQKWAELYQYARMGVGESQAILLALFASLGPWPLVKQMPAALLGLVFLYYAAVVRWNLPDQQIIGCVATLVEFLVLQLPLWALRRWSGWRIEVPSNAPLHPRPTRQSQFGMRWVFGMIFATAATAAVIHYALRDPRDPNWTLDFRKLVSGVWFPPERLIGTLPFAVALFAEKRAILWIVLGFLTAVAYFFAGWRFIWGFDEINAQIATMDLGTLASIALSLLPLRWAGCRIVKTAAPAPEARSAGADKLVVGKPQNTGVRAKNRF